MPADDARGTCANPALRAELLARMAHDQEVRYAWLDAPSDTDVAEALAQKVGSVDAANVTWLRGVIARHGWPGRRLVGDDGAHASWLLAQHADRAPEFQAECLDLLRVAVDASDAHPGDLAYLTDRVLVAAGKAQRFGTQLTGVAGERPHRVPSTIPTTSTSAARLLGCPRSRNTSIRTTSSAPAARAAAKFV